MLINYYDQLSPYYKYIYQDWEQSVLRQAAILDSVIREQFGDQARTILDAACGIGTQSIGLAQLGYMVTASDISAGEIEAARGEAHQRQLAIDFAQVDMRQVWDHYACPFDVVLACDNAIPHLLSDAEILHTFEQFYQCTRPGGGCMISVRDYATMERSGSRLYPRQVHESAQGRVVIFDYWAFDGDYYEMTTYVVEDKGQAEATTHVMRGGRYYCISTARLEALMTQAGFFKVNTLRERFFQPLIVGSRPPVSQSASH